MPPNTSDPETLERLKGDAISKAQQLGHRLLAFTTAKHDPLCHVAFCANCRAMVIVSLENDTANARGILYGYALQAHCAGITDAANQILELAGAQGR